MSGSAFKHSPSRGVSLHHGTVLVETDMQALGRYLTPDKRKLQAKGISSVGARVMNLRDEYSSVDHASLCDAFVAEFRELHGAPDCAVEEVGEDSELARTPEFQAHRDEIEDKEWRLGRTPEFSHQLDTRIDGVGVFDVRMEVLGGVITEAVIFSDALYPDVIDQLTKALEGADYGRAGIGSALEPVRGYTEEGSGPRLLVEEFTTWLVANLDD
eukprot:gnl/TRDRNA2_/TRDRNA2_163185_c0_seq4.p1 gnl/TRDRNA2_/TRDRNA2_163185_c0~~gnl/TRDRNA2_/TRDRNA2_163185_c0_seq4.p1  ORF type:complete len:214 (+),score=48.70 gnl/TRDRNA2_/TRDRNA2_163185_c0_seq4:104-745(+)